MAAEDERGRGAVQSGIRVLIVDDEAEFRESLRKLLVRRGMQVTTAASGQEGLSVLDTHPVDVVILDLWMPGIDGPTTLRMIHDIRPLARVIVLTGHASVRAAVEALKSRAFDFLLKPVAIDHLVKVIESAAEAQREGDGQ